jgi:precorrin-2 C20-methyltransferase/precorrin-3B C17-methyltransferase
MESLPQMRGRLQVVGLGPAGPGWLAPEAQRSLAAASDLVGYGPYLDRVPARAGQRRHASDNRVELERARHALALAADGGDVCVVSSGDPGIFAMATAVMEALEDGPSAWRDLDVRIVPGISAMQAAASRVGAPLGHDFCVLSLSDRRKPWEVIARRLDAAASADLALAIYNPVSSQRQWQLADACAILLRHRAPDTPVVLARDVGGATERVRIVALGELDPRDVDMRTVVLVGASTTRTFAGADGRRFVYTPRTYEPMTLTEPVTLTETRERG